MTDRDLKDAIRKIQKKETQAYNISHQRAQTPTGFDRSVHPIEFHQTRDELRELHYSIIHDLDDLDLEFMEYPDD